MYTRQKKDQNTACPRKETRSIQKREYFRTENHSCLDCSVYFLNLKQEAKIAWIAAVLFYMLLYYLCQPTNMSLRMSQLKPHVTKDSRHFIRMRPGLLSTCPQSLTASQFVSFRRVCKPRSLATAVSCTDQSFLKDLPVLSQVLLSDPLVLHNRSQYQTFNNALLLRSQYSVSLLNHSSSITFKFSLFFPRDQFCMFLVFGLRESGAFWTGWSCTVLGGIPLRTSFTLRTPQPAATTNRAQKNTTPFFSFLFLDSNFFKYFSLHFLCNIIPRFFTYTYVRISGLFSFYYYTCTYVRISPAKYTAVVVHIHDALPVFVVSI